jgi:ABC-type antimicrobial peptide transport system permease subunit
MMVVRRGATLALVGIVIGLMTVALLACAVPAFRALRISPMQSLAES